MDDNETIQFLFFHKLCAYFFRLLARMITNVCSEFVADCVIVLYQIWINLYNSYKDILSVIFWDVEKLRHIVNSLNLVNKNGCLTGYSRCDTMS